MILSPVRCPVCRSATQSIDWNVDSETSEVTASCPACQAVFPAKKLIVEMVSKESVRDAYPDMERQTRLGARFYDALELEFAEILGIPRDEIRAEYLDGLELKPGSQILDVGVGTGSELRFLSERHPEMSQSWSIWGVDISVEMLRIASRKFSEPKPERHFFVAFAEDLPFHDNSFDVVFHTGSINEFHDQRQAIEEMLRVAKPGAQIVITDEWMTEENVQSPIGAELSRAFPSITVPSPVPFQAIPETVTCKAVRALWGGFGYTMSLRKPEA